MPVAVHRGPIWRWLPFIAVVVVNTMVSLLSSVTQWWDVQSSPGTSSLPAVADGVLRARPRSSNADVHIVLWFVAALALVLAMWSHGRIRLAVAAAALWVYTGVLEVAQRWVPTRTSQWIDLVGNGVGIAAGVAVGWAGFELIRIFRRRQTAERPGSSSSV